MNLRFLEKLFAHMEWADASVWRTVLADEAAGGDDYVVDSLVHLHVVQRAYLEVWKGEGVAPMTREDFSSPVEIRDWARAYYAEAFDFLRGLSQEGLDEVLPIPWTSFVEKAIGGPVSPANLGEMAFQVVSHSVHHRAQVNRRIREVGGTPIMVDYIGWVWRGYPEPDWSG